LGDRDSIPRGRARDLLASAIKRGMNPFEALGYLVDTSPDLGIELVGEYNRMLEYTSGQFLNCHPPVTPRHPRQRKRKTRR
jgi:hypothetical protein